MTHAPLRGIRIIEVASFVAAPYCGLHLVDLGAEVVRVDPPGGGPDLGRWPVAESGASLYWAGLNRGKRSVTLDLRTDRGRDLVRRMLGVQGDATTGVLVTNAPGAGWLGHDALAEVRADLVHAHVRGAASGASAVDYTVNAASGVAYITGRDQDTPLNNALPAWDLLAGVTAAVGVVSALRRRDTTGQGTAIEVSLEDVAFQATGALGMLGEAAVLGRRRPPIGNDLYGSFGVELATFDDRRVIVVALTERQWTGLVEATGTGEVIASIESRLGVDFRDDGDRYAHRDLLRTVIAPWFAVRSVAEIVDVLSGVALVGEFRDFAEAVQYGRESGLVDDVDQPGIGPLPVGRGALGGIGGDVRGRRAPRLGEDCDWVIRSVLGMDDDDAADLRAQGVLG